MEKDKKNAINIYEVSEIMLINHNYSVKWTQDAPFTNLIEHRTATFRYLDDAQRFQKELNLQKIGFKINK